jgi:hypothetical protein
MVSRFLVCGVATLGILSSLANSHAQDEKRAARKPAQADLEKILKISLDAKLFKGPMSLKGAVQIANKALADQGKKAAITVDAEAFKKEYPDAPSVFDTPIQLTAKAKKITLAAALQFMVAHIQPDKGAFVIRDGAIVITTKAAAKKK